jgi:hypothetical protein
MMHSERELPAGARIALAVALSIALAAAVLALFTKDFSPGAGTVLFRAICKSLFFR